MNKKISEIIQELSLEIESKKHLNKPYMIDDVQFLHRIAPYTGSYKAAAERGIAIKEIIVELNKKYKDKAVITHTSSFDGHWFLITNR